jgi:hypothetical protein
MRDEDLGSRLVAKALARLRIHLALPELLSDYIERRFEQSISLIVRNGLTWNSVVTGLISER